MILILMSSTTIGPGDWQIESSRPFLTSAYASVKKAGTEAADSLKSSGLLENEEVTNMPNVIERRLCPAMIAALQEVVLALNDGQDLIQKEKLHELETEVSEAAGSMLQAFIARMGEISEAASASKGAPAGERRKIIESIKRALYRSVGDLAEAKDSLSIPSIISEVLRLSVEIRRVLNDEAIAVGVKEIYVVPGKERISVIPDKDSLPIGLSTTFREAVQKRDRGTVQSRMYASFRIENGEDPEDVMDGLTKELSDFTAKNALGEDGSDRGLLAYPLAEQLGDLNLITICAIYKKDHSTIERKMTAVLRARMARHEKRTWYNPVSKVLEKASRRSLGKKARK